MKKDIFEQMIERWPSAIVARTQIEEFTGGMISCKYIANLDSDGAGPVRIKLGRRVGYPIKDLTAWLRKRAVK